MVQVFLSSTSLDLSECRTLVYHAIEGLAEYHCVRMEDFGAWDIASDELCRQRVAACDLLVILAGPLYGSVAACGKSYTEKEFDAAESLNIPALIFLSADDFLIAAWLSESAANRKKQDAFRRRLGNVRTFKRFRQCSELATMVVQAIHNWESSPAEHCLVRITAMKSGVSRDIRRPFFRLGRNPESEVPVSDDPDVSWDHGVVFQHAGEFFYRHLSQTNSAWITAGDRQVITPPCEKQEVMLQARNKVRVGTTEFGIDVVITGGRPKIIPTNRQGQDG